MNPQVGVVGATGYLGSELLRILTLHPGVDVAVATSRRLAGTPVGQALPAFRGTVDLVLSEPDPVALAELDAVLLATPHGAAASLVRALAASGDAPAIVDLSGAHRLRDPDVRGAAYPDVDADPDLATDAVYGLPEHHRDRVPGAALVANPGCYPTGAVLAAAPLLAAGWGHRVLVASASGVSGAGRAPTATSHFPEANESVRAYNVGRHRHEPEIAQALADAAGAPVPVTFVPHLVPMDRGIHTTAFLPMDDAPEPEVLEAVYRKAYDREPFVRVVPHDPDTKHVRGTNLLDVRATTVAGGVVVTAAHDNLVKGGAGQAVQNLNLLLGLPEVQGLPRLGGGP